MTTKKTKYCGAGILLLAATVGAVFAAEMAKESTSTTGVAADPVASALLTRLQSGDVAERAAAQKEMAAIAGFWKQPQMLEKMMESTVDAELKTAIQQRLNVLRYEQLRKDFTYLPPISLSVKKADVTELTAALRKATGESAAKIVNTGKGSITLDVKDQPYWEVVAAASKQVPLEVDGTGLNKDSTGIGIRHYAISGPAIAYAGAVQYRRDINFQDRSGDVKAKPQLQAFVTIAADPRLRQPRLVSATLTSVLDDSGHDLGTGSSGDFGGGGFDWQRLIPLKAPESLGKKMTMVLDCKLTALSETSYWVDDVLNNKDQVVQANGNTYTIEKFEVINGGGLTVAFKVKEGTKFPRPATAVVYDGMGKELWKGGVGGSANGNVKTATMGPYRIEWRAPDVDVEIPLHFELKDIPLP